MRAILFFTFFSLVIIFTGCTVNKATPTHSSPNDNIVNEEIITITPQDRESINDWIAIYKKSYDTAFETVDKDWKYEDPAAVWFAQKELGFNTVTSPLTISETDKIIGIDLLQTSLITDKNYKSGELTVEQFEYLYTMHIPVLNQVINIINQYYPERVPQTELKKGASGHFSSKVNFAIGTELKINAPLLASQHLGLYSDPENNFMRRLMNIVQKGGPNMIYTFQPIIKNSEHKSYISEIKNIENNKGHGETLASGQLRLRVITYKSVDETHVKKTTSYIDFLDVQGSKKYQYREAFNTVQPELLYYGPKFGNSSENKLDITNKRINPEQ